MSGAATFHRLLVIGAGMTGAVMMVVGIAQVSGSLSAAQPAAAQPAAAQPAAGHYGVSHEFA